MMDTEQSPEFLQKKAKKDLEFLVVYSKIGENLDQSIRKLTNNLKDWLADINRILDVDNFVKIETKYIHYKEKLQRLVCEVEDIRIKGKKPSNSKIKRISRVTLQIFLILTSFQNILKFKTQKDLLKVLAPPTAIDKAINALSLADSIGPVGLSEVRHIKTF